LESPLCERFQKFVVRILVGIGVGVVRIENFGRAIEAQAITRLGKEWHKGGEWADDLNWRCQVNRKANVCLMTERDTSLQMSHFAQEMGQKIKFTIDQKTLP
jgi:hypothetical protein